MNECNAYWVQLDTNDPTLPPIHKCMQQQEYDAYMTQHAADNQFPGGLAGAILFFSVVLIAFGAFIVSMWRIK